MSSGTGLTGVIRHLPSHADDTPPDSELLARYARGADEGAFTAIVRRYGGLVLGVARRQLADPQQADDVFQATFLALARSAARLRGQTPLANWLYTVALRQARKARARAARRAEAELAAPPAGPRPDPLAEITARELLRVVDEELARLPERYRLPVLLCCVRGLSREEAAAQLGWADGAVKGRLERGRRHLAARLAARGLAPSAVVFASLAPAAGAVPPDLLARTAGLAADPWSKAVPPAVAALAAAGAPRRVGAVAALVGSVVVAGLAGWAFASGGNAPVEPAAPPPPPAARAEPAPAAADDPLPTGSTLRFGTSRYRQGTRIACLAVSADGKLAVASSGGHVHAAVRAFDLTDGRVLYTLPALSPQVDAVGLSPDGKTLAVKVWSTVHLFDAATGKPLRQVELPKADSGSLTEWITFSPDGKSVAMTPVDGRAVVLVDLEKGAAARTFPHQHIVFAGAFSPDGTLLVAGGYDSDQGTYFARLWEVATGKELRRLPYGSGGLRTVAFSPDGKAVAAGGDGGRCRVWETDTGKELLNLPEQGYRVRSVAFAPDGKTLAVAGDAIRLYDPATGKERLKIDRQAGGLRFSADGQVLTGAVTGTIHRWDPATGRQLTPDAAGESPVDQVLATPDGRRVVTRGQDGDAHLWDARTGAHLRHIKATWQRGVALSPDGRFLVWPVADEKVKFKDPDQPNATHTGSRLRLYELAADAFVDRFPGFEGDAQDLFFTADGKTLLTVDHRDGTARLWDVAAGKQQRSFRVVRENERARQHFVRDAVMSPDGKTLAVTYQPEGRGIFSPFVVRLWDVETGRERHELAGHLYYVDMVFSPDGRLLATASPALSDFARDRLKRSPNQVFIWDVATGQRLAAIPDGLPDGAVALAFAPDGRTLATATPEGTIRLWEVATWTVRTEFRGHRDRVNSLGFAPDGRLLSGGLDTTVLAWDTRPPRAAGPLDAAWDDLAKADAGPAFKAQGRLLASPDEAVKLIAEKVKPVEPADPKRVAGLVADLGSSDFATRRAATTGLEELGPAAAAALKEAAAKSDSPEVRKLAGDLLTRIDRAPTPPVEVRALRAVEVLEWVGTAEARDALTGLAKGDPSARLTQAASAALRRGRSK